MKTEDIKAASERCWGGSCYRRERACVWEGLLGLKLQSVVFSHCRLPGSSTCKSSGSFNVSVSTGLTGWLFCSFSLTTASFSSSSSPLLSSFSSSLTLCTMKRCLLSDSTDVKHRPQWRHWGVFSSVLCCGMCCWNCVLSCVTKPHFEQRNWFFGRLAEGAPRLNVRSRFSSSFISTAAPSATSDTPPCKLHTVQRLKWVVRFRTLAFMCELNYFVDSVLNKQNKKQTIPRDFFESWMDVFCIWPRSGFLIPCIKLTWFFNITLVVNIFLVSVQ